MDREAGSRLFAIGTMALAVVPISLLIFGLEKEYWCAVAGGILCSVAGEICSRISRQASA